MSVASPGAGVRADMAEQPRVVERLLARRDEFAEAIAAKGLFPARGIMLVARGSSDNAAIYGRYLLELATQLPAALAAPSLYTRYQSATRMEGWTVVAISQSGATPEIISTVDALRANGARTIVITNDPRSPLAERGELTIDLECGVERAVPATKTYLASLAALAALARAFSPGQWSVGAEGEAVAALSRVLAEGEAVEAVVGELAAATMVSHLGRGFGLSIAMEGALKYREMTGRAAEGLSASDYLHGPIASAGSETCVVAYIVSGKTADDVLSTAEAARRLGAHLLFVAEEPRTTGGADLAVPHQPVEALAAFSFVARAQQLALTCATRAGIDPDDPVGLHKITLTS